MKQDIINTLMDKKCELLKKLLNQSQKFAISTDDLSLDKLVTNRQLLLEQLQINDQAIATWESESSAIALEVCKPQQAQLGHLLKSVQENNQNTLDRLENEKVTLEDERELLDKNRQLSGYLSRVKKKTFTPKRQGTNAKMAAFAYKNGRR